MNYSKEHGRVVGQSMLPGRVKVEYEDGFYEFLPYDPVTDPEMIAEGCTGAVPMFPEDEMVSAEQKLREGPLLRAEDVRVTFGPFKFWQWRMINLYRKSNCHGWLGWTEWKFHEDRRTEIYIHWISIWPHFLGNLVLKHEQAHADITRQCKTNEEALIRNKAWDARTWHGLLFWRKP